MPSNFYRLKCESVNHRPLVFDAVCDDNDMLKNIPIFGMQAPLSDCLPFVLLTTGVVDYGTTIDEDLYRLGRTNIRARSIRLGEVFTLWEHEASSNRVEEFTYKITELNRL